MSHEFCNDSFTTMVVNTAGLQYFTSLQAFEDHLNHYKQKTRTTCIVNKKDTASGQKAEFEFNQEVILI